MIFFKSNPFELAKTINILQENSKIPLLTAIDAEWGLAMRIDSVLKYPYGLMLGSCADDLLIYNMAKEIGIQLRRIGIHINFAPVVDINSNPLNPVINFRSFGEDRELVTRKSYYYMKGLQDAGVIAVAKHFPGHGDTYLDSHQTLPVLNHSIERLDSIELYPFKFLIDEGISGVMIAHLSVPSIDTLTKLPATLSSKTVNLLLKQKLNFKGLAFTDAMNMGAITKFYKPVDANLLAFNAGNDIILMPTQVPQTIKELVNEVKKGNISEEEINSRCYKILLAKYWVGLHKERKVDLKNLTNELNTPDYHATVKNIISN